MPYLATEDNLTPWDWSRDGRFLAVQRVPLHGKRNNELWILKAGDPEHLVPFATEAQSQVDARFSPDGKWIAYDSNESGVYEVYVRPFPGPGGTWKISAAGGYTPQWRGDGKEIYYASPDNKLMAVPISLDPAFHAGDARRPLCDSTDAEWQLLRGRLGRSEIPGQHGARPVGLAAAQPGPELDGGAREEVVSGAPERR